MERVTLTGFGPIERADVAFGHLTVLVGPQASGKSLLLQTLKAVVDMDAVVDALKRHGYHWADRPKFLAELVFGEGMGDVVRPSTRIGWNGVPWSLRDAADASWSKRGRRDARVFFIPAQRVLTIQEGWPRPFTAFEVGAPFVVKQFSEDLRRLLEEGLGGNALFPAPRRWRQELRSRVSDGIFHGASVEVDGSRLRKRIVLRTAQAADPLPFMSWSAGQREFIPLMLGLYWLLPSQGASRRGKLEWAVVEEPEMGLHPKAITAVALLLLDLLKRGYRVAISTHSPHLVELVWALRSIRGASPARYCEGFARLFGLSPGPSVDQLARSVRDKRIRVYYLGHHGSEGVRSKDISALDPMDPDPDVAGWGGLTDFAERAGDVVAAYAPPPVLPFRGT